MPKFGSVITGVVPGGGGAAGLTVAQAYIQRAQQVMAGGGIRKVTYSTQYRCGVWWSSPIFVSGAGKNASTSAGGKFEIACPGSGTQIIGEGGATSETADSISTQTGIPMDSNEALYYILPLGSGYASVATNFRLVSWFSDFVIPDNWVLIARRNDATQTITWFDGQRDTGWIPMTLTAPWTNYGATFPNGSYMLLNGVIHFQGLLASGAIGSSFTTLPAGFRPRTPGQYLHMSAMCNSAYALLTIAITGVCVYAGGASNPANYLDLSDISFVAGY